MSKKYEYKYLYKGYVSLEADHLIKKNKTTHKTHTNEVKRELLKSLEIMKELDKTNKHYYEAAQKEVKRQLSVPNLTKNRITRLSKYLSNNFENVFYPHYKNGKKTKSLMSLKFNGGNELEAEIKQNKQRERIGKLSGFNYGSDILEAVSTKFEITPDMQKSFDIINAIASDYHIDYYSQDYAVNTDELWWGRFSDDVREAIPALKNVSREYLIKIIDEALKRGS